MKFILNHCFSVKYFPLKLCHFHENCTKNLKKIIQLIVMVHIKIKDIVFTLKIVHGFSLFSLDLQKRIKTKFSQSTTELTDIEGGKVISKIVEMIKRVLLK